MDSDRRYKQNGYMDSERDSSGPREDRPRQQQGPRPPLDITGPRLPRMVQTITASRCYNCSTMLSSAIDFHGTCPKCQVALHCCKQCSHFEPSTRFQCLKPIPVRISPKDVANECDMFASTVTVARESTSTNSSPASTSPKTPAGARAAFDSLFKK